MNNTIPETTLRLIERAVRTGDPFLLSCLKHTEAKLKKTQQELSQTRHELDKLTTLRKYDRKHYVQELAYRKLKQENDQLRVENKELQRRIEFYMTYYLSHKQPRSVDLAYGEPFHNTPDSLCRFLLTCPETEPLAGDPAVAVVAEDADGRCEPLTNAWYDAANGTVRLSLDTRFKDTPHEDEKKVCADCGSEDIQIRHWVNPNTDQIQERVEDDDYTLCYCEQCRTLTHWTTKKK